MNRRICHFSCRIAWPYVSLTVTMEVYEWCLFVNATFKNISVISWRSVLLVKKTGVPSENVSHWQTLSHNVIEYTSPWTGFELTLLVVIGTDCIGSCKSNYHTIPRQPIIKYEWMQICGINGEYQKMLAKYCLPS
jgi:hypothetical protein